PDRRGSRGADRDDQLRDPHWHLAPGAAGLSPGRAPGMSDSPVDSLAQLAGAGWLVGGAVRDRLLRRPTTDYDVVLDGSAEATARALAKRTRAFAFELSEGFGAWRVTARDRAWQIDLLPLGGATIEADLARRDLTINAIAEPLAGGGYVDPFGGVEDLH